jgi:hypothetical protein
MRQFIISTTYVCILQLPKCLILTILQCDDFPPPNGAFLELLVFCFVLCSVSLTTVARSPAGGDFTVEIASNRAKTTLSYNGRDTTDWPDGADHPDDYVSHLHFCIPLLCVEFPIVEQNVPSCITSPNSMLTHSLTLPKLTPP